MTLVRWSPMRGILELQEEMDRLFSNLLFDLPPVRYYDGGVWNPRVDISETEDEFVITAEIPGAKKEDLKVTVKDNVLTLQGEKRQEKETKEADYHVVERRFGSFLRSFTLPAGIEPDKIKARYEDGILRVTLPKSEEVKPKEIKVEIG